MLWRLAAEGLTLRRSSHRATGGNSAQTMGEAELFSGGCYDGA
jgi:hypothetical protein